MREKPKMGDVILAECSDDEEFNKLGMSNGSNWTPRVEDVEALYQRIKNEKLIEFQWRCPARRNPNEQKKATEECEKPVVESMNTSAAYDFDFDDDAGPMPQKLTPKSSTPKNATKKRTTTLAGIVANMEKHRIMDKLGTDTSPTKSSNN